MKPFVRTFKSKEILAETFAKELFEKIEKYSHLNKIFNIALSGGNTPNLLYSAICEKYRDTINWNTVHFYWSDERCVPPTDLQSNFASSYHFLLKNIKIDISHIHRIKGEDEPKKEAIRYSNEILEYVKIVNDFPCFDLIMLGVGTDGHVASIFPDRLNLFESNKICEVSVHPQTKQNRITLTGKVLNNAGIIAIIVFGIEKAEIVADILNETEMSKNLPAGLLNPVKGKLEWFLDKEASKLL